MGLGIPLIVIVIFLVVWIVSNVLRAQQDAAQAAAKRTLSKPVGASQPLPAQKGNSEIDRFLQEIDRLRRKGQQDQMESKTAAAPPSERPPVREQPKRVAPERKKVTLATRKSAQSGQGTTGQPKVEPLLPAPPPLPEPKPMEVAPTFEIVKPIPFNRPSVKRVSTSPALAVIQTLFTTGQGPAVAFLLHEIMSDPKCRR